jgi:RNA polymerase sigma-70 factor (ECF subfamily)
MDNANAMNIPAVPAIPHDDDPVLVRRYQAGDEAALSELYQRYVQPMYRFAYAKTGNKQEAEDLTQEIFMKLIRGLSTFEFQSSFKTWIYKVAANTIMDYWREKYKMKTVCIDDFLNSDLTEHLVMSSEKELEQKAAHLQKIMDLLPAHYRDVLECRFIKNYSLKETAEAMGKTVGNIKVLQFRALKKAVLVAEQISLSANPSQESKSLEQHDE